MSLSTLENAIESFLSHLSGRTASYNSEQCQISWKAGSKGLLVMMGILDAISTRAMLCSCQSSRPACARSPPSSRRMMSSTFT